MSKGTVRIVCDGAGCIDMVPPQDDFDFPTFCKEVMARGYLGVDTLFIRYDAIKFMVWLPGQLPDSVNVPDSMGGFDFNIKGKAN